MYSLENFIIIWLTIQCYRHIAEHWKMEDIADHLAWLVRLDAKIEDIADFYLYTPMAW